MVRTRTLGMTLRPITIAQIPDRGPGTPVVAAFSTTRIWKPVPLWRISRTVGRPDPQVGHAVWP